MIEFGDIFELLKNFSSELLVIAMILALTIAVSIYREHSLKNILVLSVLLIFVLGLYYFDRPSKDESLDNLNAKYKNALETLEVFFYEGNDEAEYFERAERFLRERAKLGYVEAQFYLGYMLDPQHEQIKEKFPKINQNEQEAKNLYHKAALNGHMMAQFYLANIFFKEKDYQNAAKFYKLAADQGYSDAQHTLGYMQGKGWISDNIDTSSYTIIFHEGVKKGRVER